MFFHPLLHNILTDLLKPELTIYLKLDFTYGLPNTKTLYLKPQILHIKIDIYGHTNNPNDHNNWTLQLLPIYHYS